MFKICDYDLTGLIRDQSRDPCFYFVYEKNVDRRFMSFSYLDFARKPLDR